MFWKKKIKNNVIHATRKSISMADDCLAPNAKDLPYGEEEKLSSFIEKIVGYVPNMRDLVWVIHGNDEILAYIIFDSNLNCSYELNKDILIKDIKEKKIFCTFQKNCE